MEDMEQALLQATTQGSRLYTQLTDAQWKGSQVFLIKRDSTSLILSVSASDQVLWPRSSITAEAPHWHFMCQRCRSYDCQHCRQLQQFVCDLEEQGMVFEGLEECSFREQGWVAPSQPASQGTAPTPRSTTRIDPDLRSSIILSRSLGQLGESSVSCCLTDGA